MQRTIKHLLRYSISATDGDIGKVEDFYFDDVTWTIRYLVVRTGSWLSGRKVLISPHALLQHVWESRVFPVNLTMDQVRNSPDIDTDKPVSRQQEEQLAQYYPWQSYWAAGLSPDGVWGIIQPAPDTNPQTDQESHLPKRSEDDQHLRSVNYVTGYHIHATDGNIGHVSDFVLDDQTWQLSCFVIDTHKWFGGKKVLVAVKHIKEVQWRSSKVLVDIDIDTIKAGVPIDIQDYTIPEGLETIGQTQSNDNIQRNK